VRADAKVRDFREDQLGQYGSEADGDGKCDGGDATAHRTSAVLGMSLLQR